MKVFGIILSVILSLFLWSGGAQAATITTDLLNSTVNLSDVFTVNIVGQDFPETQGGGIEMLFNSSVVNILSVTIDGGVWNFANSAGTINNGAGSLTELYVSAFNESGPDPSGNILVTTIEFQAVGLGNTALQLSEYALNPWASFGAPINPSFVNGSVTVEAAAIPEPGSLLLIGTGLAGILGVAGRKMNI